MFIKRQHFDMRSIVQVAQSNDFHLVLTAILRSEWSPFIIRVAPRNTEAITSNPRKAARSKDRAGAGKNQSGKKLVAKPGRRSRRQQSKVDTKPGIS